MLFINHKVEVWDSETHSQWEYKEGKTYVIISCHKSYRKKYDIRISCSPYTGVQEKYECTRYEIW